MRYLRVENHEPGPTKISARSRDGRRRHAAGARLGPGRLAVRAILGAAALGGGLVLATISATVVSPDALAAAPATAQVALERFAWLEGEWGRSTRRGTAIESWTIVDGVGLVGEMVLEPTEGGTRVSTESLLLVEMGGELFYIPKPRENPYPTAFRLVSYEGDVAVFENPTHDFPQRIVYRRTAADAMTVTISDMPEEGEPRRIDFVFARR